MASSIHNFFTANSGDGNLPAWYKHLEPHLDKLIDPAVTKAIHLNDKINARTTLVRQLEEHQAAGTFPTSIPNPKLPQVPESVKTDCEQAFKTATDDYRLQILKILLQGRRADAQLLAEQEKNLITTFRDEVIRFLNFMSQDTPQLTPSAQERILTITLHRFEEKSRASLDEHSSYAAVPSSPRKKPPMPRKLQLHKPK